MIFNTYCFSTGTKVMRTRLNVTLHVHCLSCFILKQLCFNHVSLNLSKTTSNLRLSFRRMSTQTMCIIKSGQLTLILLTWIIWRAPTNASKWRMGFNSAFKGLNVYRDIIGVYCGNLTERTKHWHNAVFVTVAVRGTYTHR
jgi:hypothetical protein